MQPNSITTSDLVVRSAATIIGPVVAVLLSVWAQAKMAARHRQFQIDFANQVEQQRRDWESKFEKDKREWEMKRENAQAQYDDAWRVADRDRENEIKQQLKRIADALEAH